MNILSNKLVWEKKYSYIDIILGKIRGKWVVASKVGQLIIHTPKYTDIITKHSKFQNRIVFRGSCLVYSNTGVRSAAIVIQAV